MIVRVFGLLASMALSGCATMSDLLDDPSVEHSSIKRPKGEESGHVLMTLREDNRLVRRHLSPDGKLVVCAETQADAISARSSRSGLELTGKGALEDEITKTLTLTYARTQVSDVVRQLSWQLCNAHLNGQIGEVFYQESLRALQNQAMAVLAGDPKDQAAALERMKELAVEAAKQAAADREMQKVLDQSRTVRAQERTKRDELLLKLKKIEGCRDQAKTAEELQKCVATP